MRTATLIAVCLANCLSAPAGAAELQRTAAPHYLGVVTGILEKDTIGYLVQDMPAHRIAAPVFSANPRYVGTRTGDDEKDSFGYLVVPTPTEAVSLK